MFFFTPASSILALASCLSINQALVVLAAGVRRGCESHLDRAGVLLDDNGLVRHILLDFCLSHFQGRLFGHQGSKARVYLKFSSL